MPANPLIIDLDAYLIHVHSDKDSSTATYKGRYGFSAMIAMTEDDIADGTGAVLAVHLRLGIRGANFRNIAYQSTHLSAGPAA